ncbi:hypothetical protein CDL15_Pgr004625 [Punica granatum]|uniref:Uncharacterized protein n=1 Tax=Punica granatum TaxID=22663 RepID=A0A218WQV8_PUNGR|nr:hypothetical protein CDL15_Pgr004625 [Punica granatum]
MGRTSGLDLQSREMGRGLLAGGRSGSPGTAATTLRAAVLAPGRLGGSANLRCRKVNSHGLANLPRLQETRARWLGELAEQESKLARAEVESVGPAARSLVVMGMDSAVREGEEAVDEKSPPEGRGKADRIERMEDDVFAESPTPLIV